MISVPSVVRGSPLQGRKRAVTKTVLYRLVMVAITVGVAFAFTRDIAAALNIGIVTNAAKTMTYYAYERLWDHVDWDVRPTGSGAGAADG